MTAKRVEDLFLEEDIRRNGFASVADAIRDADTSEAVEEIIDGLQWLVAWADEL
jgi:hypothetical protein